MCRFVLFLRCDRMAKSDRKPLLKLKYVRIVLRYGPFIQVCRFESCHH